MVAVAVLTAGCGPSRDEARLRFEDGLRHERDGNLRGAMTAYEAASKGRTPRAEQAQALANLGRVAVALTKYDPAVQAYTTLANNFSSERVNIAPPEKPAEMRTVREWIGPIRDLKRDGPLYLAEQSADQVNRKKFAYQAMDYLVALTGRHPAFSYFLAILIFTMLIKFLMTPLTRQQFHSMQKMQLVQPMMKELQEKYKDKPEELNKAMFALYREQGVNPMGCGLSMLIQFPILIALYQVIRLYNFQFRNGHFLWVNPETHQLAPDLIAKNLAQPDMILLVLYAISMYLSQKLTVMPAADAQTKQQQQMMAIMMPVMFLFVLKTFPSAFILYWLIFNVLTTWQQWHLMRKHPYQAQAASAAAAVAVAPEEKVVKRGPSRTAAKRKRK